TEIPDAITRGGRGAYRLSFHLTNSPVVLASNHTYWIGFAALGATQTSGELFVPTASDSGDSDVQAGDLIPGGWRYLVEASGSTVYSGRLALALEVNPALTPPALAIALNGKLVELSWPGTAGNFLLETAFEPTSEAIWISVKTKPFEENGQWKVIVPASFERQWFRLRRE
ncbi:MAG TPA: hypothetical protein VJS65_06185, partial [Verrucomicrobiae bacterium]|nr:hypothetical protein [Verrucomicrobiae bacterium]